MANYICVHSICGLYSYEKLIKNIQEQVLFFHNESEMNRHFANIESSLRLRGLGFDGTNASRYYEVIYEVLDEQAAEFILQGQEPKFTEVIPEWY